MNYRKSKGIALCRCVHYLKQVDNGKRKMYYKYKIHIKEGGGERLRQ